MLKVHNIETFYGQIRAVGGLSLEVPEGSIVALLGPNGAGKTTILKTICGLVEGQPETGIIEFAGKRLNGLAPEEITRLGIACVQEGRAIFEELTVAENLVMGGYIRRDRHGLQRDLARVLDCFPILGERRRQLAGTLSGGEQRMLAIGLALLQGPRLLLLDEPSLGLGPTLVTDLFQIIKTINREGTTILLVEQNAKMALQIAYYGYLLDGGRIVLSGPTEQLLENSDVREFYLGVGTDTPLTRVARYKRRRRWH